MVVNEEILKHKKEMDDEIHKVSIAERVIVLKNNLPDSLYEKACNLLESALDSASARN